MGNPAKRLLSRLGIVRIEETESCDGVIHGSFPAAGPMREKEPEDNLVYRFTLMPWSERYQDFRRYRETLRQLATNQF